MIQNEQKVSLTIKGKRPKETKYGTSPNKSSQRASYTSASSFPAKLLHLSVMEKGKFKPVHIQLIPTNVCNLECTFCSCRDRDTRSTIPLEEIVEILDVCHEFGAKAITVTGGGDPTCYKQLNELMDYAGQKDMQIGLVTNGILLKRLTHHPNLTWCRISSDDDREPAYDTILSAIKTNSHTDWAFSHVVSRTPSYDIMSDMIAFANEYDFTHVRLVSDLFDLDSVPDMEVVEANLVSVDTERVLFQGRKDSTPGTRDCYISLLKPVISPEGVFPCCGAQYAIKGQKHDYVDVMKMGESKDLRRIFTEQLNFNGSVCDVCYYSQYNEALAKMKERPAHLEFV